MDMENAATIMKHPSFKQIVQAIKPTNDDNEDDNNNNLAVSM